MDKAKFIKTKKILEKKKKISLVILFLWSILCFFAIASSIILLPESNATTIGGIAYFMVSAFIYGYYEIHITKKLGMVCPSCQKPFHEQERKLVLAAGNCPHCGEPVFNE